MYSLYIPYAGLAVWLIFSIYYYIRARTDYDSINHLYFDNIPTIFTTLGVLGTFLGIAIGLLNFDVNNIDDSIPPLLQGLVVAFWSSIIGITLSIISQKFVMGVQYEKLKSETGYASEEEVQRAFLENLVEIKKGLLSDGDASISTQMIKMRTSLNDHLGEANRILAQIGTSVGGDGDTSLLTQIQRGRLESAEKMDKVISIQGEQTSLMKQNQELVSLKFDEFAELLRKSNTEAIVEVIKEVIGGFNEKLNDLIDKLVKENFEQLNDSVEKLNKWQQDNKKQVEELIEQYNQLTRSQVLSAEILQLVAEKTEQLVSDEGKLGKLVTELSKISGKESPLTVSIENLKQTSGDFKETSGELKKTVTEHSKLADEVKVLVEKLKEIEKLRSKTKGFFNDVKEQFEEAAGVLNGANESVKNQVIELEKSFQKSMNQSFIALDQILQKMVLEYADRMNGTNRN